MSIDITKLKKNTKILVETESTVFEIIVTGPKSRTATVHGGRKFPRLTRVHITGAIDKKSLNKKGVKGTDKDNCIEKNKCLEFVYQKK